MAGLKETVDQTAWGSVHAYLADQGVDGALPTVWTDLGSIDENALSIATAEGTVYTLKDISGKVLDKLRLEPEITVNFTLLKPTDAILGEFWEVNSEGDKLWVKSLVQAANKAFKFANIKAIGSRTFEAPATSISLAPGYDPAKGWTAAGSAEILNTSKDGWFAFGTVKEPTTP